MPALSRTSCRSWSVITSGRNLRLKKNKLLISWRREAWSRSSERTRSQRNSLHSLLTRELPISPRGAPCLFSVVHLALFGVLFHVDELVALRLLVVGHAALLAKDVAHWINPSTSMSANSSVSKMSFTPLRSSSSSSFSASTSDWKSPTTACQRACSAASGVA